MYLSERNLLLIGHLLMNILLVMMIKLAIQPIRVGSFQCSHLKIASFTSSIVMDLVEHHSSPLELEKSTDLELVENL